MADLQECQNELALERERRQMLEVKLAEQQEEEKEIPKPTQVTNILNVYAPPNYVRPYKQGIVYSLTRQNRQEQTQNRQKMERRKLQEARRNQLAIKC